MRSVRTNPAPGGEASLDAGGSRASVLRAAVRRFASMPYADVTIRDVAADAGVSAPLVMKHFGSKEQLFLAAADLAGQFDGMLDAPDADLAHHLVTEVLAIQSWPRAVNPFLATLFMGRATDAPPAVRDRLKTGFVDRLARRVPGDDAALRAELVCAQLMGLSAMVRAVRSPALTNATTASIARHYVPAIEGVLRLGRPTSARPGADRARR
jgi:AcrR family transcriptional regulator